MGARSKLRSISIRMEADLWRAVEGAIHGAEVSAGVTPSTNAIIVAAIRDGLALRPGLTGPARLPGWQFSTANSVWFREVGAYTMQVETAEDGNGWAWVIYATSPDSDEILYEWKHSSNSVIACMVMAEEHMAGHAKGAA
jgi:hypothetical protein